MPGHHPVRDAWNDSLRAVSPRIALADGGDGRAILAANLLVDHGLVSPVLVGSAGATSSAAEQAGVSLRDGVEVVECEPTTDPLWQAMELTRTADVAGCVAGATRPTADVVRAAITTVGLEVAGGLVSSSFLFILEDERVILFADCAVVPTPDPSELAVIARAAARTFSELTGEAARVAMLSFSTYGSASHRSVDLVREATELVRSQAPALAVDGELQFDAAFVPSIAASKAPGSTVAGEANVFVFPSLDAGNIAYKITERIGGATALGPLLQGLAAPVHDLSRGCSAEDVYDIAAIAGVRAISRQRAA